MASKKIASKKQPKAIPTFSKFRVNRVVSLGKDQISTEDGMAEAIQRRLSGLTFKGIVTGLKK